MVKFATGLLALAMLIGAVGVLASDDKDKDNDSTAKTVTGCLQKGEGQNEYLLTALDGSTWEVKGDQVELASHVGQTVTVTGDRSKVHAKAHEAKEKTKDEMAEHGMDKNATEHGHLKVNDVTKVSDTCKQ